MNKKAIQLSVNFLVIIIISIAVFGMGIIFVNKIFFSAGKKVAEMDAQTKEELARLLDEGNKVSMPFFQKSVIHGKTVTFGIGVLNQLVPEKFKLYPADTHVNKFEIVVEFDEAFDKNDDPICTEVACDPDGWLAYDDSAHVIKMNEQGTYTIAMSPPKDADSGIYIFNAAVCYKPDAAPSTDPYLTATNKCTLYGGDYTQGYYHLQKIWLSVK